MSDGAFGARFRSRARRRRRRGTCAARENGGARCPLGRQGCSYPRYPRTSSCGCGYGPVAAPPQLPSHTRFSRLTPYSLIGRLAPDRSSPRRRPQLRATPFPGASEGVVRHFCGRPCEGPRSCVADEAADGNRLGGAAGAVLRTGKAAEVEGGKGVPTLWRGGAQRRATIYMRRGGVLCSGGGGSQDSRRTWQGAWLPLRRLHGRLSLLQTRLLACPGS